MKVMLFDTETTGLIDSSARPLSDQPHVIEFYGMSCVQEGGKIEQVGEWESLFKYAAKLPLKIIEITGIRDADLVPAPFFKTKAEGLRKFIHDHDRVVAHNLSFDMQMLGFEFRRAEINFDWPPDRLCTVEATMHLKGHRLSLKVLYELILGKDFPQVHRAKPDVAGLFEVYSKLLEMDEV